MAGIAEKIVAVSSLTFYEDQNHLDIDQQTEKVPIMSKKQNEFEPADTYSKWCCERQSKQEIAENRKEDPQVCYSECVLSPSVPSYNATGSLSCTDQRLDADLDVLCELSLGQSVEADDLSELVCNRHHHNASSNSFVRNSQSDSENVGHHNHENDCSSVSYSSWVFSSDRSFAKDVSDKTLTNCSSNFDVGVTSVTLAANVDENQNISASINTPNQSRSFADAKTSQPTKEIEHLNCNTNADSQLETMPDNDCGGVNFLATSRADEHNATTESQSLGQSGLDLERDDDQSVHEDFGNDMDSRTSELLAQAQSGFSLELSSSADIDSLLSSELALTLSGQSATDIQTTFADGTCPMHPASVNLSDSVDLSLHLSCSQKKKQPDSNIDQLLLLRGGTVAETEGTLDMDSIPDEILLLCFSFLLPKELCGHVTLVCRRWHRLAYDASLWKKLDLSERSLSGQQLRQIVQRIPGAIRYLDMSGVNNLTIDDMAAIAECCPELTDLDVGFVDNFNATMLQSVLSSCPKLYFLNVEGCRHANNEMMRMLASSKSQGLKRLNFSHCSLVDESLTLLVIDIPGITHLNIDGISWISERVVQQIASAYVDSLESLELDGNELSDNSIYYVSLCHCLHTLSVSFCERLTDSAVGYLLRLAQLTKLVLRKGPSFSAGCLQEFFSMHTVKHLTYLDLTECQQLDDQGVMAIARSCGASLKMLFLSWCWDVTDRGMEAIAGKCLSMVKMNLIGLHRLEGSWIPLAIETMPDLVYITFEQCNEVSDGVIVDAVRAKPDLIVLNYYGEIFMHSGAR